MAATAALVPMASLSAFKLNSMPENYPVEAHARAIYDLKCHVCGKVCGNITFPGEPAIFNPVNDAVIAWKKPELDIAALDAVHVTTCDAHS
jgi:hypothetical protein